MGLLTFVAHRLRVRENCSTELTRIPPPSPSPRLLQRCAQQPPRRNLLHFLTATSDPADELQEGTGYQNVPESARRLRLLPPSRSGPGRVNAEISDRARGGIVRGVTHSLDAGCGDAVLLKRGGRSRHVSYEDARG